MKIENQNALTQSLANVRLEGLEISDELVELLKIPNVDTEYILQELRKIKPLK